MVIWESLTILRRLLTPFANAAGRSLEVDRGI